MEIEKEIERLRKDIMELTEVVQGIVDCIKKDYQNKLDAINDELQNELKVVEINDPGGTIYPAGNKEEAFRSFFSDIIDKYGEPQKTDNELEAMSKDEANKSLCWRDKERWADLHNKTANLYCVRNNEIVDVPPAGWWR